MCNWRFASDAISRELGEHPEQWLTTGTEVKANPVRRVVRAGDYYLKCDRRGQSRLRGEWKSAQLLQKQQIPVAEHLAIGECAEGGCLITRAFPGESVDVYYWNTFLRGDHRIDPEPFLQKFATFVRRILETNLFHPDFHIGNILFHAATEEFALVDVKGVRRRTLFDRLQMYRMYRIPMELRRNLSRERMIRLLEECGVPNPESFWIMSLRREAEALKKEWPKRERQILSGYPKFTVVEGDWVRAVDPQRKPRTGIGGETLTVLLAEKFFLISFYTRMAQIPGPGLIAYNRQTGETCWDGNEANSTGFDAERLEIPHAAAPWKLTDAEKL